VLVYLYVLPFKIGISWSAKKTLAGLGVDADHVGLFWMSPIYSPDYMQDNAQGK
jgi:hypothetical protein